MSPQRLAWRRFRRRSGVRIALWMLGLLYLGAGLAGFFAPYEPTHTADHLPYHPPNVSLVDSAGRVRLWPVVRTAVPEKDRSGRRVYRFTPGAERPLRLFAEGRLFSVEATAEERAAGQSPRAYLLGADHRGRDVLSRILYGARISLTIGIVGVLISFSIGMIVGGISGYLGGLVDDVLQRICETLMLLPGFYVLLALRGALPDTRDWSSTRTYATVVAIVSAIYWAGLARAIRGQVLSLRSQDYVEAARCLGVPPRRILIRHLLPGTLSFAIVAATVSIPGYILMESALSMLGLGIQEPEASWGNMLSDAMRVSHIAEHPWILSPGLFLCLAVTAFNLVGDGLRDAFDPRA